MRRKVVFMALMEEKEYTNDLKKEGLTSGRYIEKILADHVVPYASWLGKTPFLCKTMKNHTMHKWFGSIKLKLVSELWNGQFVSRILI